MAEDLSKEVLRQLLFFKELGVTHLNLPSGLPPSSRAHSGKLAASTAPIVPLAGDDTDLGTGPREGIELIREDLGDCRRCGLCSTRTHIVFGTGDPEADLMFVGEAPGADEDAQGIPFVGKAGQLLTRIIEAIQISREKVYIANILKCRPPGNRDPQPNEVAQCSPFLFRQIESVAPLIIVALGKHAAQTLLETETPITRLRGKFFEFRGRLLMPTFHPSYLLRNPAAKREVWEDVQQVRDKLKELGSRYYR